MNIKMVTQSIIILLMMNACSQEELSEADTSAKRNVQDKLTTFGHSRDVESNQVSRGASQQIGSNFVDVNTFELTVKEGLMTTRINEVPLGLVLKELGRQAKIKVYINPSVTEVFVTSNFENMPLEEGIKDLLSKQNYTLVYKDVDSDDNASDRADQKEMTRIAELRIVSESEPVINVKSLSNHEILTEASSLQKERELYAFKARVEDALADSDRVALEELKQEILNFENAEAAAELFDEAVEEYQSESEDYQVGTNGVFGTATSFGQSSSAETGTNSIGINQANDLSSDESSSLAPASQLNDMQELRDEAKEAFATGDPQEINKVARDVVTSDDVERAMDAFTEEAEKSGFIE